MQGLTALSIRYACHLGNLELFDLHLEFACDRIAKTAKMSLQERLDKIRSSPKLQNQQQVCSLPLLLRRLFG